MTYGTQEQLQEIGEASATMLAALGEKLPQFLAGLRFRERVIAVDLLDSANPFPDPVYECFITAPAELGASCQNDPTTTGLLKMMGVIAKAQIQTWPPEKLMGVFAALADLAVTQTKPAHAEASRYGKGDFFSGASSPLNGWG